MRTARHVYDQCGFQGCRENATHDRWTSNGSEVSYCWAHWMKARLVFGDFNEKPFLDEEPLFDE